MFQWNDIEDRPSQGVRLLVRCVCGWWGPAKLTVYGWRGDDGRPLPSAVEFWTRVD